MVNYVYLMLLVLLIAVFMEVVYNFLAFLSLSTVISEVTGQCSCHSDGVIKDPSNTNIGTCIEYDTCNPTGRTITAAEIISILRTYGMILVYLLLFIAVILESQQLFLIFLIAYGVMVLVLVVKILAYFATFPHSSTDSLLFPATGNNTVWMFFKLGGFFVEIFVFIAVFFIYRHLRKSRNLLFTLNLQSQIGSAIQSNISDSRIASDIGSRAEQDAFGFLPKSRMESKLDSKSGKKGKGFLKKGFLKK